MHAVQAHESSLTSSRASERDNAIAILRSGSFSSLSTGVPALALLSASEVVEPGQRSAWSWRLAVLTKTSQRGHFVVSVAIPAAFDRVCFVFATAWAVKHGKHFYATSSRIYFYQRRGNRNLSLRLAPLLSVSQQFVFIRKYIFSILRY